MELLLNCARQTMPPETIESTRALLRQGQQWNAIVPLAWRHGVASLLYTNLGTFAAEGLVPPEVRRRLFLLYEKTSHKNHRLLRTLARVLGLFARHRIPAVTLKGAFLSQQVYTDIALRPFLDLDLLIDKRDYSRAKTLLLGEGFELDPGLLSERLCWEYHFNLPFVRENQDVVELHWNLTDTFSSHDLDIEAFWSRARATRLSGEGARVLCPEDLITHLACHLAMHGYINEAIVSKPEAARWVLHPLSENRLIWFTDLYEIISAHRWPLDWPVLIARARESGADVPLFTSLALLNRLFGDVVGEEILSQLRPPRPGFFQRRLFTWLEAGVSRGPTPNRPAGYFARVFLPKRSDVQFRLIRLAHVWDYIFPRPDVLKITGDRVHRARMAAAYLRHVARAIGRCTALSARIVLYRLKKSIAAARPASP